jgi:hypothetical protein
MHVTRVPSCSHSDSRVGYFHLGVFILSRNSLGLQIDFKDAEIWVKNIVIHGDDGWSATDIASLCCRSTLISYGVSFFRILVTSSIKSVSNDTC